MAAGRAGERVAERVVPQVMERRGLPAEMLGAMAQGTQSPATVFHGSPHLFQRFDASKIGTGEGNQTYGYGLYFAESPDVAKSYQSALSADRGFSYGGKTGLTRKEVQDMVNAKYGGGYLDGVIRPSGVADSFMDDMVTGTGRAEGSYPRQYKPGSQRAKIYDELRGQIQHTDPGNLYQVDLPDEQIARMLDFDKPLSEQAKPVREALSKLGIAVDDRKISEYDDALLNALMSDQPSGALPRRPMNMTGGQIIRELQSNPSIFFPQMMQGRELTQAMINPAQGASSVLRQAGIPGIRYLDQGSRGAGQGTSNFVVFPGMEDMLRIEQINEQPIQSLFQNLGR
jgi:hypothetical protein